MYLKAIYVIFILFTVTTANRHRKFLSTVRCALAKRSDLVNSVAQDIFLFSPTRGFLGKTNNHQSYWLGYNLLSSPVVHKIRCFERDAICAIYVVLPNTDRGLFITITQSGKFQYSYRPTNVAIKFYSREQLLLFFHRGSRFSRFLAYPILISKLQNC